ncbi:MAG TPA: spore coat U domain-containing protein [Methylococcus sp.]|nr:spore coat U domain-containing protein [Methylococcus sp.]
MNILNEPNHSPYAIKRKGMAPASLGAAAMLLAGLAPSAIAATATSTLTVSATVARTCTISTTTQLAFGTYDPVGANASTDLNGTGQINVACTKGTNSPMIGMDLGQNASGSSRRMTSGTDYLVYEIYQPDSAGTGCPYTTVWGNTGPAQYDPGTVNKTGKNITVCGKVPANQDVAAGNYTDTVVATINF